jgi:MFS superfamily sulfate permease-like transporter
LPAIRWPAILKEKDNAMTENERTMEGHRARSRIKQDFLASIVVFLVALPLCMGIAIASGVPVAAGLTVIVYEIVQRFGLEMLGIVVLMGGAIQIAAGVLKLEQWFRAVSPAVIKGMLAGIVC